MQAEGGDARGRTPAIYPSFVSLLVDIENGQPDQNILKPILNLLVGGTFDAESNFRIKDPNIVLLILELAKHGSNALKLEIWSQLAVILKRSLLNVQACTDKDLLSHCLSHLLLTNDASVADKIVEVLTAVVSYNISVTGLRTLFTALQAINLPQRNTQIWPQHASRLVHALRYITGKDSPDVFFSFNGAREAAVTIPPLAKWPTQPGFTIHTWIRLDPQPGVNMAIAKPFLYWFRTGKGFGYSAHFSAHTLVVTACSAKAAKGKPQTHQVAFPFQPRQWFMVSIVHTFNRLKANEVQCYVNGTLASKAELPFVTTKEPFDKCYLGTSPAASANDVFSGQMTAFYLFQEPLSADHIYALSALGPSYKGQFKFPGESDRVILNHERKLLYDGKLSNSIVFMYSPKACDGQLCLESSPTTNPTFFVHSPHATLLEGVRPMAVHSFRSALYSIGGVEVLFPLFHHLDLPHFSLDNGLQPDYQLCSSLLQLLVDVLEQSTTVQQQMLLGKGFLVLSDLLLQNSPKHLTVEAMDILLRYCNRLVSCSGQYERSLLQDLLRHIMFNAHLWIRTDVQVQIKLFSSLATLLPQWQVGSEEKGRGVDLRRDVGVPLIIDILQHFYYLAPSPIFATDTSDVEQRPDSYEMKELRSYILLIVSLLVSQGKGVRDEELSSILTYLSVEPEENVSDVLALLHDLFKTHPESVAAAFDRAKGIPALLRLLHFDDDKIRASSIRICTIFLHHLPSKRLAHFIEVQSLLVFLINHVQEKPFTYTMYRAIYDLMIDNHTAAPVSTQAHVSIVYADIMVLLFQILLGIGKVPQTEACTPMSKVASDRTAVFDCQHTLSSQDLHSKLSSCSQITTCVHMPPSLVTDILSDIVKLLDDRPDNCHTFSQISHWQGWLLKFLVNDEALYPSGTRKLVLRIFFVMMEHSVRHEKDGWMFFSSAMALAHAESVGADTVCWMTRLAVASLPMPAATTAAAVQSKTAGPSLSLGAVLKRRRYSKEGVSTQQATPANSGQATPKASGADGTQKVQDEAVNSDMQGSSPSTLCAGGELHEGLVIRVEGESEEVSSDTGTCIRGTSTAVSSADDTTASQRSAAGVDELDGDKATTDSVTDGGDCDQASASPAVEQQQCPSEPGAEQETVSVDSELVKNLQSAMGSMSGDDPSRVGPEAKKVASPMSSDYDMLSDLNVVVSVSEHASDDDSHAVRASASDHVTGEGNSPLDGPKDSSQVQDADEDNDQHTGLPAIRKPIRLILQPSSVDEEQTQEDLSSGAVQTESAPEDPATSNPDQKNADASANTDVRPGFRAMEEVAKAAVSIVQTPLQQRMTRHNLSNLQATAIKHMPAFEWCKVHYTLLELVLDVLDGLYGDIDDVLENPLNATELPLPKQGQHVQTNVAHILFVVSDLVLGSSGGLDGLMKKAMFQMAPDATTVDSFLMSEDEQVGCDYAERLCKVAVNVCVRGAPVHHSVEVAHNVGNGGMFRQIMRIVLAKAIIANLKTAHQVKEAESRFFADLQNITELHQETASALKELKISQQQINKYLTDRLDCRQRELVASQSLFSQAHINLLYTTLFRKIDEHKHNISTVLSTLYVLNKLLVVQYQRILDGLQSASSSPTHPSSPRAEDVDEDGQLPPEQRAPRRGSMPEAVSPRPYAAPLRRLQQMTSIQPGGQSPRLRERLVSTVGQHGPSVHRHRWRKAADSSTSPLKASKEPQRPDLTKQVEAIGTFVGPFLKDLFQEFPSILSQLKTTSGEPLLGAGRSWKPTSSVVELVMLLCSQEWQMSIQRSAGSAFNTLVAEGTKLARQGSSLMTSLAAEALAQGAYEFTSLQRKHTQLQYECRYLADNWYTLEQQSCTELLAAHRRGHTEARRIWRKVWGAMSREFGPWAVAESQDQLFLRLDMSFEDRLRRRVRFIPNPNGSSHPEATHTTFTDSPEKIDYSRRLVHESVANIGLGQSAGSESPVPTADEEDDLEATPTEPEVAGRVVLTTECVIVTPGLSAPGTLTCTTSALYFAVDETSEEYKSCSPDVLSLLDCFHAMWEYSSVTAVYSRSYMQQRTAVEVFFTSRASVFFNMSNTAAVRRLVSVLPRVGAGTQFGLPASRATSLLSPSQLLSRSNMTQRWQRREISNFEYLMFINTIAGRTYNDLNQYPVFPWVLSNYHCKHLDLNDPGNFRDLTQPIGCLNVPRLSKFEERYELWEDDAIPKFHYGTHYSTSAFTMSWLIRVEPFATYFLQLQSGKFDMPGRTFSSLPNAWQNCLQDTSDVKELIPELFYLPEMFTNSNKFVFGEDNDGKTVDDVDLPPWASSPEDFVRLHSQALESEYVSSHLHHWIDLIFGFKQRGEEAVKAKNTFYYLTYEGSVQLDQVTDPISLKAVEQQINSFGQTPAQLSTEPHPSRNAPKPQYPIPINTISGPVAMLSVTPDVPIAYLMAAQSQQSMSVTSSNGGTLASISCNQMFAMNKCSVALNTQSIPEPQMELDPELGTKSGARYRRLGEPLDQSIAPSPNCFTVTEDCRHIIAAGYWDYSLKCFATESSRLVQSVFGHRDLVTCVAYSADTVAGNRAIVVSGSRDATVLLWHWSNTLHRIISSDHDQGADSASAQAILTGHELAIVSVAVNADVGKVVSCSQGGRCLVHTCHGEVLHSVQPKATRGLPTCVRPHHVKITACGHVVLLYADGSGVLAVFSNTGEQLACKMLVDQALAVAVSQDGRHLVLGGIARTVEVRRCSDLASILVYPGAESSVRALTTTADERFVLAGLSSGSIVAYPLEFPRN
ncbi:lipopolysaccharide-responsive and beige-like anchor protein [Sycon ciliatum]|uniref:lipopolysaccharide-responsive and beige-like anchor protein n=1 Tax=Sycon ciliatum TaxID=27933 RepID=UPI0031F61F32